MPAALTVSARTRPRAGPAARAPGSFDSHGDGLCCDFGAGKYEVFVDGELVASGSQFSTNAESTEFTIAGHPKPPSPPPANPPPAPPPPPPGTPYTMLIDSPTGVQPAWSIWQHTGAQEEDAACIVHEPLGVSLCGYSQHTAGDGSGNGELQPGRYLLTMQSPQEGSELALDCTDNTYVLLVGNKVAAQGPLPVELAVVTFVIDGDDLTTCSALRAERGAAAPFGAGARDEGHARLLPALGAALAIAIGAGAIGVALGARMRQVTGGAPAGAKMPAAALM